MAAALALSFLDCDGWSIMTTRREMQISTGHIFISLAISKVHGQCRSRFVESCSPPSKNHYKVNSAVLLTHSLQSPRSQPTTHWIPVVISFLHESPSPETHCRCFVRTRMRGRCSSDRSELESSIPSHATRPRIYACHYGRQNGTHVCPTLDWKFGKWTS